MISKKSLCLTLMSVCLAAALIPALAQGDTTSNYAPSPDSRTFAGSDGGWTGSVSQTGVCMPALTCPTIENSFQPSGGAGGGGDGFIRTMEGGLLSVGIVATSSGIYESPTFAYDGAGGQAPSRVAFTMDRRADVAGLLALPGASADFTVQLIDHSGGPDRTVVSSQSLAGATGWTQVPAAQVNPSQLAVGHTYSIRIVSQFATPATLVPAGSADYDNVVLSATSGAGGSGNGSGGNGGNNDSNGGGGGVGEVGPGIAVLFKKHLYVRVKCARSAKSKCRVRMVALTKRKHGKPLTRKSRTKVKAGKSKVLALKVKPAGLSRLNSAKKVLVRQKVVTKRGAETLYRRLKLIRR
jgi:hypothetical protein